MATSDSPSWTTDDEGQLQGLVRKTLSKAFTPVHYVTSMLNSPAARKAYITTALFTFASLVLLGISTIAYLILYCNYVPQIGLERVLHLQFSDNANPFSLLPLSASPASSSPLVSQQAYDIALHLHLPRTPANLALGNFMLDVSLLSPSTTSKTSKMTSAYLPSSLITNNSTTTIAHSRRPAILTQTSSPLQHFTTLLGLPWYIVGLRPLRNLESEKLVVPMFERVEFPRGRGNVPAFARVELIPSSPAYTGSIGDKLTEAACPSRSTMQIYSLTLSIRARFTGLRWIMYNHRIISFSVFTTTFYIISLLTMSIAWIVLSFFFSSSSAPSREDSSIKEERQRKANGPAIKAESEEPEPAVKTEYNEDEDEGDLPSLSDSIASPFPTLGRQMPLRMPLPTTSGSPTATTTASARGSRGGTISEPATAATASTSAAAMLEGLGPGSEHEEEGHLAEADDEGDGDEGGERDAGGFGAGGGSEEREGEESAFRDSGVGTSVDESVRERRSRERDGLQRRRSTRGLRDD
ncbi:MAG: hypothetical protein Q9160_006989 [Pyrenula sp. 1 TL-2023]